MNDSITYRVHCATINYNPDDKVLYGKLSGTDDLVTFEAASISELRSAFEAAVDDYIEVCTLINKANFRSFKNFESF